MRTSIPRAPSEMTAKARRTMHGTRGFALVAVAALSLGACIGAMTPVQRMQDAVIDLNTATRFGRMDIAIERVSRGARDEFARKHATWGGAVRIADSEVSGMRLVDKGNATVTLSVSWQRTDESELRATQISQKWKDHQGKWLLESEERIAGDVGLLGEATVVVRSAPTQAQFETITIR